MMSTPFLSIQVKSRCYKCRISFFITCDDIIFLDSFDGLIPMKRSTDDDETDNQPIIIILLNPQLSCTKVKKFIKRKKSIESMRTVSYWISKYSLSLVCKQSNVMPKYLLCNRVLKEIKLIEAYCVISSLHYYLFNY